MRWQLEIDSIPGYADQVARGKLAFKQKNKPANATFSEIRSALGRMCSGALRCVYCEDSAGYQVEHMRPKDLYPNEVFVWLNYAYACGLCNGPKNNRFGVLQPGQSVITHVTRPRNSPIVPPVAGAFALIDPRIENPLNLICLDLLGTFYFLPMVGLGAADSVRAEYTIELLGLNSRDYLPQARAEAFESYFSRLSDYRSRRGFGGSSEELDRRVLAIKRMQHPTVWREMQRQQARIPALRELFDDVPEALNW